MGRNWAREFVARCVRPFLASRVQGTRSYRHSCCIAYLAPGLALESEDDFSVAGTCCPAYRPPALTSCTGPFATADRASPALAPGRAPRTRPCSRSEHLVRTRGLRAVC